MKATERTGGAPPWLWALLGALLVVGLVYGLRHVLSPIALAVGIAYLLDPLVDRIEARGVPRAAAIALVLALLAAGVGLFLLLVLPSIVGQVVAFLTDLPAELEQLRGVVEPWLIAHDIPIPHDLDELIQQLAVDPREVATHVAAPAQAIGRFVLGGTASLVGLVASALVVPVLAFYVLYDWNHIVSGARDLVPGQLRPLVVELAQEIDAVLGQFLRGQLLVMLAMALLYSVAYSMVGVRLAIPIGLIAGLLAFIPYVGSGSALLMGLLMTLVNFESWWQPAGVVAAYAICQFLEGFVIVPRVVGDKVGLPAIAVLVALMIGGEVFGFLGVLLAVPVAAVVKIFVLRLHRWYLRTDIYRGEDPKGALAAIANAMRMSAPSHAQEASTHEAASPPRAASVPPAPAPVAPTPDHVTTPSSASAATAAASASVTPSRAPLGEAPRASAPPVFEDGEPASEPDEDPPVDSIEAASGTRSRESEPEPPPKGDVEARQAEEKEG